ncbi:hypothetical protein ABZX30_37460, partial [Streptomyces sp. NPDC004542]
RSPDLSAPALAPVPAGRAPARPDTAPWHVVRFEEGAHEPSAEETWWLEQMADHFAATVARYTTTGELASVRVTFIGRGNGSVPSPGQARVTATDRAEAARRVWEQRVSRPPNSGARTALDYRSGVAQGERLEGEGSRKANRTVTVRVEFIPRPAPEPRPAADDQRPPCTDTHRADPNPRPAPKAEPRPVPATLSVADRVSAILMGLHPPGVEDASVPEPDHTARP